MKTFMSLGAVLILFCGVCTAAARGEDGEESQQPGDRAESQRTTLIEEFDADGDGRLDSEERTAARRVMRDRRRAGPAERGPRGAERGDRRDFGPHGPDGPRGRGPDGGPLAPPTPRGADEIFDRFDRDGNGALSRQEFHVLTLAMRRLGEQRRAGEGERPGQFGRGPDGPPPLGQQFSPPPAREFGPPPRGDRGDRFERWRRRFGRNEAGPPPGIQGRGDRPQRRPPLDDQNEPAETKDPEDAETGATEATPI